MAGEIAKQKVSPKPDLSVSKSRQVLGRALAWFTNDDRAVAPHSASRLIFGLDLTGSREPSLHEARIATAGMFQAIKSIGLVTVKLMYFRGVSECQEGRWHDDPETVSRSMVTLSCESGYTQIERLLKRILSEKGKLAGAVYVGDHCEEEHVVLTKLARELGRKSIPLYVFHECADYDERSLLAKPLFKRLAELSGGFYVEFKPDSKVVLRELLSTVAAFSTAGRVGLKKLAPPTTPEARLARGRLQLGPGSPITK